MFGEKIQVTQSVGDIAVHGHVLNRAALRDDGDAALIFEIVGVHHEDVHLLVFTESAGLPQQLVNQRGFAVVNVGNDGDVAQSAVGV